MLSRKSITFDDDDADSLTIPHNDALVTTLCMLDIDVRRVLFDPGSSANIIQLWVIEEMQLTG